MLNELFVELTALAGFAALVTVLVNILKFFNVVKDGDAPKWVAGFNLLGLIALFVYRIFNPSAPLADLDEAFMTVANILVYILAFLGQLGISRLLHNGVRGVPLIGTSNS